MDTRRKEKRAARGKWSKLQTAGPSNFAAQLDPNPRDPSQFLREYRIREALDEKTENKDWTEGRFITQRSLQTIWSWETLTAFLSTLGITNRVLITNIRKNLTKTISILADIDWREWGRFEAVFLQYGPGTDEFRRNDTCLPYALSTLKEETFLGKDSRSASDFFRVQHIFIPVVIQEGTNQTYHRDRPLPFIKSEQVFLGKGGYGSVTKEVVACYQYRPMTKHGPGEPLNHRLPIARKWFEVRGNFRSEAKILEAFNSNLSENKRIVQYLAIITTGDEDDRLSMKGFNILLPLADVDLKDFLYEKKFETRCSGIKSLILEAAGLAHAIEWLHRGLFINDERVVCCHMDLKLDNVLVFLSDDAPVGLWKIADFGISSIVEQEPERENDHPRTGRPTSTYLSPAVALGRITGSFRTSAKRPAGPYSAPEVAHGSLVGTPSDIWSLGCILCQVLARGIGGIGLLKELDQKRAIIENGSTNDHFCQRSVSGVSLHPHVEQWLKSHHSLLNGTFTERKMVMNCKRLILETLNTDHSVRPKAEQVHLRLLDVANDRGPSYRIDENNNLVLPRNIFDPPSQHLGIMEPPRTRNTPLVTVRSPTIDVVANPPPSAPQRPALRVDYSTPQRPPTPPPEQQYLPLSPQQSNPASSVGLSPSDPSPRSLFQTGLHSSPELYTEPSGQFPDPDHSRNGRSMSAPMPGEPTPNATRRLECELQPDILPQVRHNSQQEQSSLRQNSTFSALLPRSERSSGHSLGPVADFSFADGRSKALPFPVPKNVASTVISSARAMVAFISPQLTSVYALYPPYSWWPIQAQGKCKHCKWVKGAIAGNFLALRGECPCHPQPLYLYSFEFQDWSRGTEPLNFTHAVSNFEKFAVSVGGKILLGSSNDISLYHSHINIPQRLPTMPIAAESGQTRKLQQLWFSTNGRMAFARFSLPNNIHRFTVWDTEEVKRSASTIYQVPPSQNSTMAMKAVIPFHRAPACLLWKEHGYVSLIQFVAMPPGRKVPQDIHLVDLQAAVVTPHEDAVIFICASWKGFHRISKVSVSRLVRINNSAYKELGTPSAAGELEHSLEKAGSDIAIEAQSSSDTHVRLLIAHSNGSFETKDVSLPP